MVQYLGIPLDLDYVYAIFKQPSSASGSYGGSPARSSRTATRSSNLAPMKSKS
jgi:hypothetical protein